MPWNRPATNNYFGFAPVNEMGGIPQTNYYLVTSSATNGPNIFAGDVLVYTSMATVRPLSSAGGVTNFTSSMSFVGVAAQFFPAGQGSTSATLVSNQMILVYDNPAQRYVVADTTSGPIGTPAGLFKNYALLTTGPAGSAFVTSTVLGRSNMALNGVESSVAGVFHVTGLHPMEQGSYPGSSGTASTSNMRKWIGYFVSGVQVQPSTGVLTVMNTSS